MKWALNKGIVKKGTYFVLDGDNTAYKAEDVIKNGKNSKNWIILFKNKNCEAGEYIAISYNLARPVSIYK